MYLSNHSNQPFNAKVCFHRYSQSFLFPIFHKKIEDEDSLLVPVFKWVSSTKVLAPQSTPLIHFNTLGCITQDFLIIDKSWQADMKTNKHKVNGQVEWFGIIDKKNAGFKILDRSKDLCSKRSRIEYQWSERTSVLLLTLRVSTILSHA